MDHDEINQVLEGSENRGWCGGVSSPPSRPPAIDLRPTDRKDRTEAILGPGRAGGSGSFDLPLWPVPFRVLSHVFLVLAFAALDFGVRD